MGQNEQGSASILTLNPKELIAPYENLKIYLNFKFKSEPLALKIISHRFRVIKV